MGASLLALAKSIYYVLSKVFRIIYSQFFKKDFSLCVKHVQVKYVYDIRKFVHMPAEAASSLEMFFLVYLH